MSHPDEGLIHAWLDGECTPEEAAHIERLVATDPEWAAAVAEARGLVAASSRIVSALDAVPHALPEASTGSGRSGGSSGAQPLRSAGMRVRPWLRIAAAFVLVAGTAYALRERSQDPFRPKAQADVDAVPAAAPAAPPERQGAALPAPPPALPSAPLSPQPAAAEASIEEAAADAVAKAAANDLAARRSRAPIASRGAAGAAAPAVTSRQAFSVSTLEGCWRVSAPQAAVGSLRDPLVVRVQGDSLSIRTPQGDVTVVRVGDRLRGGLEAVREPCEPQP